MQKVFKNCMKIDYKTFAISAESTIIGATAWEIIREDRITGLSIMLFVMAALLVSFRFLLKKYL